MSARTLELQCISLDGKGIIWVDLGQVGSKDMVPAHIPCPERCHSCEPAFFRPVSPHATCKSHRPALPGRMGDLRRRETKLPVLAPFLTAPICGTPAPPPGHSERPEQCRPGRPAQVASVHPVQDGTGGDPVLRSSLSVLSSLSGLHGPQCQHSGLAIMGFQTKQFDPSRLGNILVLYILFLV